MELDDDEGGRRYEPVLRFNFMVLGYISSPDDSFRGYKLLMNVEGKKFIVVHSLEQVKSFKDFKEATQNQIVGKDLEHNVFDPSLWSELFTRVKFDSSQKEGYREDLRPALNWGLQIAFLKEKAMQSKWMVENMEVVYPDHVLDHDGKIKESSTHVIVPGLIPLSLKIKTSSSSGLEGLLEMLLPPRTSEDHEVR